MREPVNMAGEANNIENGGSNPRPYVRKETSAHVRSRARTIEEGQVINTTSFLKGESPDVTGESCRASR